jgi:hypothetical protein
MNMNRGSGVHFLAWLAMIAAFGALAVFLISNIGSTPLLAVGGSPTAHRHSAKKRPNRPKAAPKAHRGRRGDPSRKFGAEAKKGAADAASTAKRLGKSVLGVVIPVLAGLAVLAALLLTTRTWARRRRRYQRLALIPHRADDARPDDVRRMLEAWHQQVVERWWRRILFGQPSIALEVVVGPDAEGAFAARLTLVCPVDLISSLEGSLFACYPDSQLAPTSDPLPAVSRIVRLKKRQVFVWALRRPDPRQRGVMDAVLNQMASLGQTAVLQYVLVPTPALFDRYSRRRFSAIERNSEAARATDPGQPGLRSEVLGQELEGGLDIQHRPLFFAEIRIASTGYREAAAIAGGLRGESAAENRLVERFMRPWGRGSLYLRRLAAGIGNPIPGWHRGVLSSTEICSLWQLPSPGLRSVRVARSAVPRILAPPEISRDSAAALARDEHGVVGIRPEDKTDGLGLIGGQKTGKTSLLCRTVQADALDPSCAVVVLMPKPGDALKALSMVPPDRTVHYLDLERPEFGINPLSSVGDPGMVADKVVEAFVDVNAEGDIRGSSDRYLRQAAQAAIGACRNGALEGPPNLWHLYRMLLPVEHAFRERVVEAIAPDPRYADTATFFGRVLPDDLANSPGQTTAKLDAPRNKLMRLMVESLDKVLRHPLQLDLDEVVRKREVLIVDGKMGTFGADNCRVMMQFILNALFGTLQRQQQLPEAERVRVALKVDEAHLVINESFADALATLRSAGLEVVAAWQYSEQIQDPKIRAGLMSLLRQRCMFSMGESEDAREMSRVAMSVYSDLIRDDAESRARLRLTPDTIVNLPNHFAVCSWISRGARVPAFLAKTMPLDLDETVVEHHLQQQRDRGCHVPERLPDPMPDLDWEKPRELPTRAVVEDADAGGASGGAAAEEGGDESLRAAPVALGFDPGANSVNVDNERAAPAPPQLPETYTELDLDNLRGITWDKLTPLPADRRREPTNRELEILGALWSYRFLFASQIHRRWWRGSSLRASQQALNQMAKAGWVRRFKLQTGERGAQQRVYCLNRQGFELGQERTGRSGSFIDPEAKWREPVATDARRILRSLRVNGWGMAFEHEAGNLLRNWRGPRAGRLEPPRRRIRGEWIEIAPGEVVVGSGHKLRDFAAAKFETVTPDATLELSIPIGEERLRFDLLVEFDMARSNAASIERLQRYDGLISGWSGMLDRYKMLGTPPVVLFVCEDEHRAMNLLRIADRAVTARLAKPGAEETEWPHPGRKGIFVAVERDMHLGSMQALQLPELPPDIRERLEGKRARKCQPRRVHLIEPSLMSVA